MGARVYVGNTYIIISVDHLSTGIEPLNVFMIHSQFQVRTEWKHVKKNSLFGTFNLWFFLNPDQFLFAGMYSK